MIPTERPERITKEYAIHLLSQAVPGLRKDLIPDLLDYFVAVNVLALQQDSYEIAGRPGRLGAYPTEAVQHLRAAITAHGVSSATTRLLYSLIPGKAIGGSGASHDGMSYGSSPMVVSPPPTVDKSMDPEKVKWERRPLVASMAPMSAALANGLIDAGVLPADYAPDKAATARPTTDRSKTGTSEGDAANTGRGDQIGLPARITGEQAAAEIGVGPAVLSNWRNKTPAWASGNTRLFQHLMERDAEARYHRDRVLKLARWFGSAQTHGGGQKQVECP